MGRLPKVDHVRDQFTDSVDSALSLFHQVQRVSTVRLTTQCPRLHVAQVRRVIELAFMGIVSAWEEFIERSLIRYLAGATTATGYSPQYKLGPASSLQHAYQALTGDPSHNPARHYVSWNDPGAVVNLALVFFEGGHPYHGPLTTRHQKFKDATKLRNRVAHQSDKCRSDFKEVALRFNGLPTNGKLKQGYRVGDLLLETAQRHFGQSAASRGLTFFEAYCEVFRTAAGQIVR